MELTLEQAMKVPEKVAVDFETTGLRWWEDTPLTMGLATNEKLGYVDLRKYSKEALSRFFHDFLTTHKTIYHNAKFDLHIIDWSYLALTGLKFDFACSLILSQIWDERIPHDLDYLSETFLGVDYLRDKRAVNDYIKEHKLKDWSQVPFHLLAARGVEDARNTYLLYDFIRPMVSETKVYQLEKELTMTLLLMERNGIQIDKPYLLGLKSELEPMVKAIDLKYPERNFNSVKQLQKMLFEEMKLKPFKYTSKGNPSTDAESLRYLASQSGNKDPLFLDIIEYKTLTHTLSTYVDGFLERIDPLHYLHCTFRSMGARTGRLSCVEPNLQQVPKRNGRISRWIKTAFLEDITTFDYSQMEAILYAFECHDEKLIEAILAGVDVYKYMATNLYSKKVDEIDKHEREIAKTLFLGRIYGMGDALFEEKSEGLPPSKVNKMFAKLNAYNKKVEKQVIKEGYSATILGRKRHLQGPEVYKAVNSFIQGSAADIVKMAMVRMPQEIKNKMRIQVHDELIFVKLTEEEKQEVKHCMTDFPPYKLSVDYGSGRTWHDAVIAKDGKK